MGELTVHQLHATALTLRSLVEEILRQTPRDQRERRKRQVLHELVTSYWRGLPGQSRIPGEPPTATDLGAVPVLEVVHHYWPRPLRPLA